MRAQTGEDGGVDLLNARLLDPLPGFIPHSGARDPQVSTAVVDEEMALFRKAQS